MASTYNKLSVARVQSIIDSHGHYREPEDRQTTLRDILTDLRHYADEHELDFYKAADGSHVVYLEEKNEEA